MLLLDSPILSCKIFQYVGAVFLFKGFKFQPLQVPQVHIPVLVTLAKLY